MKYLLNSSNSKSTTRCSFKYIFLSALCLCIKTFLAAQNSGREIDPLYKSNRNILKTPITSFPLGMYRISYERSFSRWFSLSVTPGIIPEGSFPLQSIYEENLEEEGIFLSDAEMQAFDFTLEARMYVSHGYGKGFYLAPYYRYADYNISNVSYDHEIFDSNNTLIRTRYEGGITHHSGGILLGSQWYAGKKKKVVIDFWFLGIHGGVSSGELKGSPSRTLTINEQESILEDLEDPEISFIDYTSTVDSNSINISVDGPWLGLRAGLAIGYRF